MIYALKQYNEQYFTRYVTQHVLLFVYLRRICYKVKCQRFISPLNNKEECVYFEFTNFHTLNY